METSPLERESKTVLDCGFHPLNPGFKALDSRFQSVVQFRIPWFVLRIPKPKIPESTNISRILDSGFHKQKFPGFQNPRLSWILDSSPYILDSRYWILYSLSVELGFRSIASGILDSLSCIPDSKAQDSGFHKWNFPDSWLHKQNFPEFPNPD